MKLALGLIALAHAGTWKRSGDEEPADEPVENPEPALCALYNYDMYAAETEGVARIYTDDFTYEASMDEHDEDTCTMSMYAGTENEIVFPSISCDCTNPTDYFLGMEDPDTCEEAESLLQDLEGADDPAVIDQEGVANFKAQLCGESDGDEEELSLETMCYLFNYERFTQNGPGPDYEASEWPTIFPKGSMQVDDSCDENGCNGDFCTATAEGEDEGQEIPCNCNKPEEFIKNMLNKDVCAEAKILAATPDEGMTQAGVDNFESLVCGFQINFLSFGLILICTLFKF